jgi:hypothetical protein
MELGSDLYCSCGLPAVTVFQTERFGPVGWCGRTNVGAAERSEADEEAERSEVDWGFSLRPAD